GNFVRRPAKDVKHGRLRESSRPWESRGAELKRVANRVPVTVDETFRSPSHSPVSLHHRPFPPVRVLPPSDPRGRVPPPNSAAPAPRPTAADSRSVTPVPQRTSPSHSRPAGAPHPCAIPHGRRRLASRWNHSKTAKSPRWSSPSTRL